MTEIAAAFWTLIRNQSHWQQAMTGRRIDNKINNEPPPVVHERRG